MPTSKVPLDVTGRPTQLRRIDLDRFFQPETVAAARTAGADGTGSRLTLRIDSAQPKLRR